MVLLTKKNIGPLPARHSKVQSQIKINKSNTESRIVVPFSISRKCSNNNENKSILNKKLNIDEK